MFVTDQHGTYDLTDVVAIKRGGTPHPDLGLPRAATAILVYRQGAEIATLIPYDQAVQQLQALAGPAAAAASAPAGAAVDPPAGAAAARP